ncbi:hypothetical protein RvY_07566-2 [Ramazzottius varieornatus]|uniref:Uncharacterized protein n=1 Tax=Ramazzottius varieornatus TaxID=947166 RepID=A0A1D1V7P1_RAMVA|nr:hypothetical protein RvY_07566-2 [Ramazzottius varieornatus]
MTRILASVLLLSYAVHAVYGSVEDMDDKERERLFRIQLALMRSAGAEGRSIDERFLDSSIPYNSRGRIQLNPAHPGTSRVREVTKPVSDYLLTFTGYPTIDDYLLDGTSSSKTFGPFGSNSEYPSYYSVSPVDRYLLSARQVYDMEL